MVFATPYKGYNEVMLKYAEWTESFEGPTECKVDITKPVTKPVTEAIAKRRAADPGFKTGDGVHPNAEGSLMIAKVLLEAFGVPSSEFGEALDLEILLSAKLSVTQRQIVKLAEQRNRILSVAYREHVGHKRPGAPKSPPPLDDALGQAVKIESQMRDLATKSR